MASLFEQRHFEATADMFKRLLDTAADEAVMTGIELTLVASIRMFRAANYRFRTLYFLNKCGYTDDAARRMLERHGYQYNS
jgi:hypothetical protein